MTRLQNVLLRTTFLTASVVLPLLWAARLPAQAIATATHASVEVAITYQAARAERTFGKDDFFLRGGAVELSAPIIPHLLAVAEVCGEHAARRSTGGAPFSEVITTFGIRYRHRILGRADIFGGVRIGESNAFDTTLPGYSGNAENPANGSHPSALSLALLSGGGLDVRLSQHFGLRAAQVEWLRTQLPNGQANVQDSFRIGAGLTFRFARR